MTETKSELFDDMYDVNDGTKILDGKIKENSWYIPKFIIKDYHTTIYGDGGCGKSTLLIYLALSIAAGKSTFLGETIQGKVLFIDEEMGDSGFKKKVGQIAETNNITQEEIEDNFHHMCVKGWSWSSIVNREWLEYYCSKHSIDIVFIDSLLATSTGDIISGEEIAKLKKLCKMGYRNNITFVLNHHTNKAGKGKKANSTTMYGSIIIDQTMDHTYGLMRYGKTLVICQDKTRWVPPEDSLNINTPIEGFKYGVPFGSAGFRYKRAILKVLEQSRCKYSDLKNFLVPESGRPNIENGTMSEPTLSKYLGILVDEGKITKKEEYYLTCVFK